MTKKHFIALADTIRKFNSERLNTPVMGVPFNAGQIAALADFCASQNSQFDRKRWLGYIAGDNGGSR